MNIIVNNQKIDISLEQEKTIGDFLKGFEENCAQNNATIIAISIDGETLSADKIEDSFDIELSTINNIELSTVSVDDVTTSLKELAQKSETISNNLLEIPILYQTGKDGKVSTIVTEFADFFNLFCRTISLSTLFPERFENLRIDQLTISEFLAAFSKILLDFENALKENDIVLIGDLSEYEISPRLQLIHTVFSQLNVLKD